MAQKRSLYDELGVAVNATDVEIRRAYRTRATRAHPDRGGTEEAFTRLNHAYEVLSDLRKRELYDATGTWERAADEELRATFAGGSFRDRTHNTAKETGPTSLDQLIVSPPVGDKPSHSAGFEAWLRARGMEQGAVFTAEDAAAAYGVTKTSYESVPLPRNDVHMVRCMGAGPPRDHLSLHVEQLPSILEWGQMLVDWLYAPINLADLYSAKLGGIYGSETMNPPYVAGHDGVGIVSKVGPGVKDIHIGDLVLPTHSFIGTWSTKSIVCESDVMRIPTSTRALLDVLGKPDANAAAQQHEVVGAVPRGVEVLALAREAAVAYLLLERYGGLKPGDAVLVNAPTSSVGQTLLQLARLLKLRAIAIARPPINDSFIVPTLTSSNKQSWSARSNGHNENYRSGGVQRPDTPPRSRRAASSNEAKGLQPNAASIGRARKDGVVGQAGSDDAVGGDVGTAAWQRLEAWLKDLGATLVIRDEGSVRAELERSRFFSKPRLALDAVGGQSAVRLAEALADGGELVCYGCMSGRSPAWPWQTWVFRELKISGFNLRRWMATGGGVITPGKSSVTSSDGAAKRFIPVLESLLRLVAAGMLQLNYTQYDLSEFTEALDHAEAPGRTTKVLLRLQA